jgi:oligosaccharide repeat unit polymerase
MQAGNSGSTIVNILVFAVRGIGFICSSVFINNIFSCGKLTLGIKKNFILLIPIITLLFSTVLSTARNGFIGIIIMFFFYVFDCVRIKQKLKIGKIFKWGVVLIAVFLAVFSALGSSRGQSATLDTICIYAGSSIVAFSVWFSKGMNGSGSLFGSESFVGIHELIARFFPNYKDLSLFDKFITFPNGSQTNIYTAFKAWIADFGWLGCLIFCLLIGFFFGIIYLKTIYKKYDFRTCLFRCVYAYFLYYLIYSFATPELTTSFLSVTQLMEFFFILVFYYLIFVSLNRRKKINGIQK